MAHPPALRGPIETTSSHALDGGPAVRSHDGDILAQAYAVPPQKAGHRSPALRRRPAVSLVGTAPETSLATSWVLFGALALSVAAASLSLAAFPRWLGWTGLIVGIWLITAPTYWTSPVAFTPYVLFWIWLVSLSVVIFRRAKT